MDQADCCEAHYPGKAEGRVPAAAAEGGATVVAAEAAGAGEASANAEEAMGVVTEVEEAERANGEEKEVAPAQMVRENDTHAHECALAR